jgi:hypothetical protein
VANAAGAAVINAGTITDTGISFINRGTVVCDGLFENQSIEGAPTIDNPGTILIDSTSAGLGGTVAVGTVEVGGGRNLEIAGTLDRTAVQFTSPGSLQLDEPNDIVGATAISGFGSSDEIWLGIGAGLLDPALSFSNGTLDVSQRGTHFVSIPFNGNFTLGNFAKQVGGPIVYAADNGYTGITSLDIAAPDQASVTQGSTLIPRVFWLVPISAPQCDMSSIMRRRRGVRWEGLRLGVAQLRPCVKGGRDEPAQCSP